MSFLQDEIWVLEAKMCVSVSAKERNRKTGECVNADTHCILL